MEKKIREKHSDKAFHLSMKYHFQIYINNDLSSFKVFIKHQISQTNLSVNQS